MPLTLDSQGLSMFIDRWTGAPARLYAIARPAMVAAALLVALTFSALHRPAQAHGGEDHGTAASVLPTATQPRAAAVGDEIEAVAVIKGDDLLIYVDRFGDNSPVLMAARCFAKVQQRNEALDTMVRRSRVPALHCRRDIADYLCSDAHRHLQHFLNFLGFDPLSRTRRS